jgi:hypothetical protein
MLSLRTSSDEASLTPRASNRGRIRYLNIVASIQERQSLHSLEPSVERELPLEEEVNPRLTLFGNQTWRPLLLNPGWPVD